MAAPMLPPPLTEQAEDIDRVWNVFLIGAVSVFAFVVLLVLIIVVRFRRRDDRLPRQVRLNLPFELTYTFVPLLIVGALFAITFISVRDVDSKAAADEIDLTVGVVGFRWQWRFEYPEQGVIVSGSSQDIPELVLRPHRP